MIEHSLRRHQRYPTDFAATIVHAGVLRPVRVRDISAGGMMIEGDDLPARHQRVKICAEDLTVRASLVWRVDGKGGLLLESLIEPLAVVRSNHPQLRHLGAYRRTAA